MTPELDSELCAKYPLLYAERHGDPRTTALASWGFECDDGWVPLLRELSEKLESLIHALPEDEQANYHAEQVKEKVGGLRFYMPRPTDAMREAIRAAEALSTTICEICGAPGETRGGRRIKTLCDEHEKEHHRRLGGGGAV